MFLFVVNSFGAHLRNLTNMHQKLVNSGDFEFTDYLKQEEQSEYSNFLVDNIFL